jgi:predicted MFS family arabinose efflux permease
VSARDRLRVLGAGIFSMMLALGIARFAYTPLLPLMQAQAGLGLDEAGYLAAINYLGYLTGALIASRISSLVLKDRLYRIGMVLAVLTTALMAASTDFYLWALSRYFAGLASAAGMLLGTALSLNWLMRHQHRSELGIHFAGLGIGIALAAGGVALMNHWLRWDAQWWVFTALACVLLVPALRWLPPPDTSGLTAQGAAMPDAPPSKLFLRVFMAVYFCCGVGYVVTATFIVAIIDALPGLAGRGTLAFLAIGAAAAPACIVWDLIARRVGDINALILAAALQIIGILLPLASGAWLSPLTAALLGSVLFGGTFIGMVSLVLTMAGRYYPTRPAKMMGKMTLAYGAAQILAPTLLGQWAKQSGSYANGLLGAAGAMLVGVALLLVLRRLDAANPRA